MSYRLQLSMSLNCDDSDEAEDELDALAFYVAGRIEGGVDYDRVVQAMVEALVELSDTFSEQQIH